MVCDLTHGIYLIQASNTILIVFTQLTLSLNAYGKLNNRAENASILSLCTL